MSHFTCLVISKEGQNPESLLDQYDENLEVEEYDTECYCVDNNLYDAIHNQLKKEFGGTFEEAFRDKYNAIPKDKQPNWEEYRAPYFKRQEELKTQLAPTAKVATPGCDDCSGTGVRQTQYNPKSKWDWYQLGGRWRGNFILKQGAKGILGDEGSFAGDPIIPAGIVDQAKVKDIDWEAMRKKSVAEREIVWEEAAKLVADGKNTKGDIEMRYGSEILKPKAEYTGVGEFHAFAVVTPDGKWHEKGDMGWFGMASNEKSEQDWDMIFKQIMSSLEPTDTLSMFDLHI